ncbi:DUF2461 domain-containing protein [Solitalea sp. MAHUQ-68]|uniref:DUF2461 domain-containing protein n=1 Tax=Solitalea agri TaxID=2953739 RepID=A0A9X2F825_9SPHI|nr:DUF2461 domain-containing protein [Solitalea agri]MCO4293463.1 DUF2461 domain-containing protein [Solitalea agri]
MLKQTTFDFLKELADNNNREWFTENKKRYDAAKQDVEVFVDKVLAELAKIDVAVADINAKQCVMRIYRDVRFSKDKSPYKKNFGIVVSPMGKGVNGPCYYLHIEPGTCFAAGGYWMPEAEHIKSIRQEIDYNTEDFKSIIEAKTFKQLFNKLDEEGKLKTAPKGYPADHPEIELLKLKSFTVSNQLDQKELLGKNAIGKVLEVWKEVYPFNQFLINAIAS